MTKKCCMNCEIFYYDTFTEIGFCTIDKETVKEPMEQIKFCKAYKEWSGAVE